jgi:hypothetical protein
MGDAMDRPDESPSTRTPFGEVPFPGTPPMEEVSNPDVVVHRIVDSPGDLPMPLECSCGLRVEGPEAQHVMDLHIMEENDWDE